jgi:hypothetical protein
MLRVGLVVLGVELEEQAARDIVAAATAASAQAARRERRDRVIVDMAVPRF